MSGGPAVVRTRQEVEQEIHATRSALLAADEAAEHDPAQWALGDVLLEQLAQLTAECALLPHVPHPRLPAATDGHATPQPY